MSIKKYRDHPAFMKVDGKPLIIFVSATVPLETWTRVFTSLRDQGLDAVYLAWIGVTAASSLEVFDGLHDYSIFNCRLDEKYLSTRRAFIITLCFLINTRPGFGWLLSSLAMTIRFNRAARDKFKIV
jgi:hypothetical protein